MSLIQLSHEALHTSALSSKAVEDTAHLTVRLARNQEEIQAAQRLRFEVFSQEYGAQLGNTGIDSDIFDAYCDHLIVRDEARDMVVGTYRILTPQKAKQVGCWYSDSEFFLDRLQHIKPNMIEVGRSCVHSEYRSGAAIMLLWSGLSAYLKEGGFRYLVGCASVPLRDGGALAATLHRSFEAKHMVAPEHQVFPKHRFPVENFQQDSVADAPPLIKGYLRVGAKVCGAPSWDPDFHTADFLMMMSVETMNRRYKKHFGLE